MLSKYLLTFINKERLDGIFLSFIRTTKYEYVLPELNIDNKFRENIVKLLSTISYICIISCCSFLAQE